MRFLGQWGIWIVLSHPPEWGPCEPTQPPAPGGQPRAALRAPLADCSLSPFPSFLLAQPPMRLSLVLGLSLLQSFPWLPPHPQVIRSSGWGSLLAHLSEVLEMSQCPAPFLFRALSILCKHYTQTLLVHCFVASCFLGAGFILGCGGWVCIVDCGVASLASTHWMPVAPPQVVTIRMSSDIITCLVGA